MAASLGPLGLPGGPACVGAGGAPGVLEARRTAGSARPPGLGTDVAVLVVKVADTPPPVSKVLSPAPRVVVHFPSDLDPLVSQPTGHACSACVYTGSRGGGSLAAARLSPAAGILPSRRSWQPLRPAASGLPHIAPSWEHFLAGSGVILGVVQAPGRCHPCIAYLLRPSISLGADAVRSPRTHLLGRCRHDLYKYSPGAYCVPVTVRQGPAASKTGKMSLTLWA